MVGLVTPILELGSMLSVMVKMHLEVVFSPRKALDAVPLSRRLPMMVILPLMVGSQEDPPPLSQ